MSDTVIYNGVNYDVEKVILMKGAKALIDTSKQTNVQNAFSSDKIKYPIVIPVGDDFYTLIKPAVEAKNPSVAFVLSKFTLKKLRDEPVVVSRLNNPVISDHSQVRVAFQRTKPAAPLSEAGFQPLNYGNMNWNPKTVEVPSIVQGKPGEEQPWRGNLKPRDEQQPVKLTGIEVLRERARVQQQEYQSRNQHDDRQNNYNRNSY